MINDSINRFLGVLCYPFTSMEMFREDLIYQYIDAVRTREEESVKKIRNRLKSELIAYIRKNYTIYSYDEIYLYLEKCYLYYDDSDCWEDALQLYQHIMERMAAALISHRDGRIVFKYWKNKNDEELFGGFANNNKVALFHSLSCHIPMDVIAIVYMIINQPELDTRCLDYFYGNIEVADQQLSRVLEKGVAENHLHKGVSRTFSSIWDSLMEPLTAENSKFFWNREFVDGTKEENKRMVYYILGCGIVRAYLTLEISLDRMKERHSEGNFYEDEVEELVSRFQNGQKFEKFFRENFQDKRVKDITVYYEDLWNRLERRQQEVFSREKLCITILNEKQGLHTTDENVFLYYALYKMIKDEMSQRMKQCMMQYLRVRNYLFHVSVQQKTIKGLDYFQQAHYSVNSALNHVNIKNFWEAAIREQLQNQDLYKLEFRSSMPINEAECKMEIRNFLEAYQKILWEDYCYYDIEKGQHIPYRKIPHVGLVVHFLKRPDMSVPEKCFQNGKGNCSYFYFGELQEAYKTQIENFIRLRTQYSELSRYLVGIDAASLENSTPVWVFAPIYEEARDSSVDQIGRKNEYGDYTQSLGFTFHAGEDFRHILSGLRRIDEAQEYLKFHAGDRIGHGIALGISAREWKRQNPVIIIPQIEALENYLWAYDMLSKNYSDFQATILAYMEKQIYELSGKIYGNKKNRISGAQEEGKNDGREGIGIEILIADLDVVEANQLYQMNQIHDTQNVIVCINSDDPAVFNTNVSNELAYIYYGMLEQNISREAALLWIDRIRKNGLDSSFIHHRESDELLVKRLEELIKSM